MDLEAEYQRALYSHQVTADDSQRRWSRTGNCGRVSPSLNPPVER